MVGVIVVVLWYIVSHLYGVLHRHIPQFLPGPRLSIGSECVRKGRVVFSEAFQSPQAVRTCVPAMYPEFVGYTVSLWTDFCSFDFLHRPPGVLLRVRHVGG